MKFTAFSFTFALLPASSAFSMIGKSPSLNRHLTSLYVASLDPQIKKSQSTIDDELSSLATPKTHQIKKLHSILDDGEGHINSDLARSVWQWENKHFHPDSPDDLYPAKRLNYSTRDGLRLVDELAQSIGGKSRYADMVQEGVVALMRCTVLWDEEHSAEDADASEAVASFEKFARENIEQTMRKVLSETRDNLGERMDVNLDLLKKRGAEQVKRMKEKSVTDNASSAEAQPLKRIVDPLSHALEDANPTPEEIALSDMIRHDIGDFLERKLTDTELKIIRLRFGLEDNVGSVKTTEEIAEILGLDIPQVIEEEKSALQHLRATFEDDYIGAYLDDDHANEVSL